jgi:hypothetical protein
MDKKISSKVKKLGDKWSQRTHNNLTDLLAKSQKRTAGRLRALDRLTKKEEVEKVTEAMFTTTSQPTRLKTSKEDKVGNAVADLKFKDYMAKRREELQKQGKLPVKEATSAAIRMQRALEKIKAERERRERLAAPFVNSVFGKKDEKKPEPKKD